ncbi:hypothetical protein PRUPE_5G179400 [Prunus persica]|uniref:Uncharacterized protein n=2 Tax=Prunus persica TaxID=3760 RepID=A0A251PDI8_PRUPE|nr:hypothetical protein PRUPE_5G179400 [Prunus persica]
MESLVAELTSAEDLQDQLIKMTVRRDELYAWFREIREAINAVDLEKYKLRKEVIRLIEETTSPNIPLIVYNSTNNDNNIVNPYPSMPMVGDHTSRMANQGKASSMFVVVKYVEPPYSGAVFEIKLKRGGEDHRGGGAGREGVTHEPQLLEPIVKLFGRYAIQTARIFSRSQLFILLENDITHKTLHGYAINTKSLSVASFVPPGASKRAGVIVSAYGKLYHLAAPVHPEKLSFDSYDPATNLWTPLPNFPFYSTYPANMHIVGHAVCYGFILFSMCDCNERRFKVAAFHVSTSVWREVKIDTYAFVPFRGRAVVVGKTIYALSQYGTNILAFSFFLKMDEGDFACSLNAPLRLQGLEVRGGPFTCGAKQTEYLVHLGNNDFCHIRTAQNDEIDCRQYLCITTFQIVVGEEGSCIKTLDSTVFHVDVSHSGTFYITFSFAPECEDFEPEEEKESVETKCKVSYHPHITRN